MNCWHCKTELIWGGDEDLEEDTRSILCLQIYLVQKMSL